MLARIATTVFKVRPVDPVGFSIGSIEGDWPSKAHNATTRSARATALRHQLKISHFHIFTKVHGDSCSDCFETEDGDFSTSISKSCGFISGHLKMELASFCNVAIGAMIDVKRGV